MYWETVVISISIVIVHFIGKVLSERIEQYHMGILSFGAGLMVGAFFLEILPQLAEGEIFLKRQIYLYFLFGFILVHVLEKIVYKHQKEQEIERDMKLFEGVGLLAYYLLVGFIIVIFFEAYGVTAYFIVLPFFIRAFAIGISSSHIDESIEGGLYRLLQFVFPLVGTFIGSLLIVNKFQLYIAFSFVMGLILYIIVRDMIPIGRKGKPLYFVVGALTTVLTFLFL